MVYDTKEHGMDFRAMWAKDVGKTVVEAVAKCASPVLEPKYDGWRCIVIRTDAGVDIYNPSRSGSVASKRYNGQLPELEADLMKLPVGTILDGELVAMAFDAATGRWTNDFFRIHTCMRSKSTVPAQRAGIKLIAFDCIEVATGDMTHSLALPARRRAIEAIIATSGVKLVELTVQMPATQQAHDDLVGMGFEGSVIKDTTKPYAFAKRGHGWFKVKDTRTIDCIVMEVVQDGKGQHLGKAGKMIVGQLKDGAITRVCSVNCLNNAQRDEATAHPERFVGKVIEVKIYGWDTEGPRHPTPLRFRDDKTPAECIWSRV